MICKVCGREEFPEHYYVREALKKHNMCFSCNFWREQLANDQKYKGQHKCCMIDGTHYIIGEENDQSAFRGFGGTKFQIEFNDGFKVVTTNLWCQGEPPEHWRDKFPDNARFENNLKWQKIGNNEYLIEKKDD